jgi:hypothetical protein
MFTKSDLQAFRQCARRLWLLRNSPELAAPEDPSSVRRARDGNTVGEKAREQLGTDFLWPPSKDDPAAAAINALNELRQSPTKPIAEMPVLFGDLYARADALVPLGESYVVRDLTDFLYQSQC